VHLYEGDLTTETVLSTLAQVREASPAPLDLEPFAWDVIAASTMDFYDALRRR
jgi:hypothetical protein